MDSGSMVIVTLEGEEILSSAKAKIDSDGAAKKIQSLFKRFIWRKQMAEKAAMRRVGF